MSISDFRREAVAIRLSRKRDILGRRKEALSEIFYFTQHPDVPSDSESIVEQELEESSDLKEFLNANNLESGHIFQENTLPNPHAVVVDTSLQAHDVTGTVSKPLPPPPPPPPPPLSGVTPQNSNSTSNPVQPISSGSSRMVTRVSSGAIRHKSVGELLGERDFTSKHTPTRSIEIYRDPSTFDSLAAGFQETPSNQKTPVPSTGRVARGTVFQDSTLTTPVSAKVELDRLQAAAEIFPLYHLVSKAHKSVRTSDWTKALEENQAIAICNRITELKDQHLWSLRQPAKQKAPNRPNSHWDYLLKEMEWMSTDFYEERKFKMAGAFMLARAVQEYHMSSDRKSLLHKWPRRLRAPMKHFEEEVDADEDVLMVNHRGSASPLPIEPTPELEKSLVNGDIEDSMAMIIDVAQVPSESERDTLPTPSPSSSGLDDLPAIFDLPSDIIYASVNDLPKKDGSSLSQLPLYGPPTLTEQPYRNVVDEFPIVPISRYCLERYIMPVREWEPPNRHYHQLTPERPDEMLEISKEVQVEAIPNFAPAGADSTYGSRRRSTAIFIRPPAPPNHWNDQKSSPWTQEEERLLLQLAKDNMYNFDLVASALSFSGSSVSDLERRSAWECFEKFRSIYPEPQNIQFLGPNRNLALNRLEKNARLNMSSMSRPRPNVISRQPRLEVRNHRYLNLFDAMKKSAKNREKSKSQEKPAVKKPKDNLPTKPAVNVPTPLDLSRLKAEKDRAFNQALLAERQAQAIRLQMPPNASPEMQEELRRQWLAHQQQALLNAQAGAQGLRQNPGIGRGLVIPGGPNGRPMPIRPNTGSNPVAGGVPVRLLNGVTATPEQVQQMLKARQMAMAANSQNATVAQTPQQMQRLRALQQQAQLNTAQSAGQNTPVNQVADYIPFIAQPNGALAQNATQAGNLTQSNRLMQPPQNGAVAQGMRQGTSQQLQVQAGQGLRVTPPRPSNLSPTAQHFALGNPPLNVQSVLQLVQQNHPQLSIQEATKVALEHFARLQQGTNGHLQQHLPQQVVKSSPTQPNQQIRRSPSQNAQTPHTQGQQRMT